MSVHRNVLHPGKSSSKQSLRCLMLILIFTLVWPTVAPPPPYVCISHSTLDNVFLFVCIWRGGNWTPLWQSLATSWPHRRLRKPGQNWDPLTSWTTGAQTSTSSQVPVVWTRWRNAEMCGAITGLMRHFTVLSTIQKKNTRLSQNRENLFVFRPDRTVILSH